MPNCLSIRTFLILLAIAHAVLFAVTPHGFFTVDEFIYYEMAAAFADRGAFDILNGFDEAPVDALRILLTVKTENGFFPQYPSSYALLVYPFFVLFGLHGLVLVNSLAFFGIIALTYGITERLFARRDIALTAAGITACGTYMWHYGLEIWPHLSSLFFMLAAIYPLITIVTQKAESAPTPSRFPGKFLCFSGLWAGLWLGCAISLRYDAAFALPALLVPLFFMRPIKWRTIGSTLIGLLPLLLLSAWLNDIKFDHFSPFSYGNRNSGSSVNMWRYAGIALAGIASLTVIWLAQRNWNRLQPYRLSLCALFAVTATIGAFFASDIMMELAIGIRNIVLDTRLQMPDGGN